MVPRSPIILRPTSYVRSISLPSRSHSLTSIVEEHLQRSKASSEAASSSSSSASAIYQNLCALRDLYESVNDFLRLPLIQQSLTREPNGNWAERVLDGSLRLLDFCGTTRDVLVQAKESIRELQSSVRRKRGGESGLAGEMGAYMRSRKKINKMATKYILHNVKTSEKICPPELSEKHSGLVPIIRMFREVEAVSISVFKSLLSFASGSKETSNQSHWKWVSGIMHKKTVACDMKGEADGDEVKKMDGVLNTLNTQKSSKDISSLLKQLGTVEMSLHELEEGLEPIFRCLLKTRVCLLNAVGH